MVSIKSIWLTGCTALLAFSVHAGAGKALKSTISLDATLERSAPLSRREFLSLFGVARIDTDVLILGLKSSDPLKRRICALQLGEGPIRGLTHRTAIALFSALRDQDLNVVAQAIASILRIGRRAPQVLLPFLTSPVYLPFPAREQSSPDAMDVAIAGLYESHDVPLDELARAYARAIRRPVVAGARQERATNPAYLLSALAALLTQSADINAALISQLLDSENVALRAAVLPAAGAVSMENPDVTASVMNLVIHGADQPARAQAATVLAGRGEAGREALFSLSRSVDSGVRAAAWAALVSGSECNSPLLGWAINDPDGSVRETVLTALLASDTRKSLLCLMPLANDVSLSPKVRMDMLEAYANVVSRTAPPSAEDVAGVAEVLRPLLTHRDSLLFESAWAMMGSLLVAQGEGGASLLGMAGALFSVGGVLKDDESVLCALSALPPRVLSSDVALVNLLAAAYLPGSSVCLAQTLANLDPQMPSFIAAGRTLAAGLEVGKSAGVNYSPKDLALLAAIVPYEALQSHVLAMAQRASGNTRLEIYQILAARGVAVNEALSLLTAVLHGDASGLGDLQLRPQYGETVKSNWQTTLLPNAVDALLSVGPRGAAVLADELRSSAESQAPAQRAILSSEKATTVLRQYAEEIVALAEGQGDWDVRLAAEARLPQILTGAQLSRAASSLVRDADIKIAAAVADWILQRDESGESGVDPAQIVSAADWQFLLNRLACDEESGNRDSALQLLRKLRGKLSPEFVGAQLERALGDANDLVVESALRVTADFGELGAQSLRTVLESDKGLRLAGNGLPATVNALGDAARSLLPPLLKLHRDQPDEEGLLASIGLLSHGSPEAAAVIDTALVSNDDRVRAAALAGMSLRQAFFANDSGLYLAALIEARIEKHAWARINAVTAQLNTQAVNGGTTGGGEEIVTVSATRRFARFPWPPPPWSFKEVLPDEVLAERGASLANVSARIVAAVRSASADFDYGLFGIPDGFVVLARRERIRADGTPFPGRERWSNEPLPATSLEDYVVDLFFDPPGYFRTIAFVVTGSEPSAGEAGTRLPEPTEGAKSLPEELGRVDYGARHTYALVYTFERVDGGRMSLNYEGSPSGLTHLKASGIWSGFRE